MLRSLRVVAVILGATACQRSTTAPREGSTGMAPASSSAGAPTASAPAPSVAPAAVAPPKEARRIEIDGLDLADPVAGREPGASHPKGTVIALAYPRRGPGSVGVVEIDVATGTEVKRSKVTVDGLARLVREGDTIHLAAASTTSFVWSTMDLALEEKRRVTPKTSPVADGERNFEAFAVVGANAVVVSSARGAVAELLDGQGKTLARHDCRANVASHGHVKVEKTGTLTIVGGLVTDSSSLACGFRSDGSGAPIRKKLELGTSLFTHEGVAYANGTEVRRLDGNLAPTGPAMADPRPCSNLQSSCSTRCTSGVTGDATLQKLMMSDVLILQTVGCCGGTPGGLFFCDPSAQVSAER